MNEPSPVSKYSIEPHGDANALYWGRTEQMHGYNLCRIDDLSHNCDLTMLEKTLNEGVEADGLRKRIAKLEAGISSLLDIAETAALKDDIRMAVMDASRKLIHTNEQ